MKTNRTSSFEKELTGLLRHLHAAYDLKLEDGHNPSAAIVDLWALATPQPAPEAGQNGATEGAAPAKQEGWPIRENIEGKARDYRVYAYFCKTKDPTWDTLAKEVDAVSKDKKSGVLLLMGEQKGYFMTSGRVWDLLQLFSPGQDASFKISVPKLRKAAVSRFFSLTGYVGELADAVRRSK